MARRPKAGIGLKPNGEVRPRSGGPQLEYHGRGENALRGSLSHRRSTTVWHFWNIGTDHQPADHFRRRSYIAGRGCFRGADRQNTAASAAPEQQFTPEQLASMQGLVKEKLQSIEEQRQVIIDKGAREGKTIATEAVLRHLEASKAAHQGANREAYVAAADKLAREFREKYPDTIPADEAYRLMKEWE